MKSKFNKESRNLLIEMLLGDGTISNNNVYKLSHSCKQRDYLEWKIKQLNEAGIRHTEIKSYISSSGYNKGNEVIYTQLNIIPFIKVLRRIVYKNGNKYFSEKLLNRVSTKGIAIWYMDDGHINFRKNNGKICGFYIKLSICKSKEYVQTIIDFFKKQYDINFYSFHEGKQADSYSICCGTKEGIKFIELVKPYVFQVPSMIHKITYDLAQRKHNL